MVLLVRLRVLAAVTLIVLAVLAVAFFLWAPRAEPEDPFQDLIFSVDRDRYTFGEEATLVLRNEGNLTFLRHLWGVQRFVESEWMPVECHSQSTVLFPLRPGEEWSWSWTVETADPICTTLDEEPLPRVEEGSYRGFVVLTLSSDPERTLFDEFVVA